MNKTLDEQIKSSFIGLIDNVKKLRSPEGCDWCSQSANSLIPYFIEEVYELIDGLDNNDSKNIKEELGDVLLHIVFQSQIASEERNFTIDDVINDINKKLIDRHPDVFNKSNNINHQTNDKFWEKEKQKKKGRKSRLDGIPEILPSIISAQRMQEKASSTGFDWDSVDQVLKKLDEEIGELKSAQNENDFNKIEDELGDLLFTTVNLCRFFNISGENALRKATKKFRNRFHLLEKKVSDSNKNIDDFSSSELDKIWIKVKKIT